LALTYTVDAGVTVKLFVQEPYSEKAQLLFSHLADDDQATFYVPDLLYIECANVLWKYTRRLGYDARLARDNLEDLSKLALTSIPTELLFRSAFELAREYNISAYDAVYMSLARSTGTDLVTADKRLVRQVQRAIPSVRFIGDFKE
jgi:predicted nucleic acid-binding protein